MGITEIAFSDPSKVSIGEKEGMASLGDVAQRTNVSLMTVSWAINEPERLRPETYKKVTEAVDTLGYVSDLSVEKVRGAKTTANTIGVLALDTMITPFSVGIMLSIEKTAQAYGWDSSVVNMFSNDKPEKIVDLLLVHRPDGIIYTVMRLRQVPVLEKLRKYRCVLANYENTSDPFPTYIPDDEQGQYLDVEALLVASYRRLLCIHLPKGIVATDRRRAGMERACRKAGIDPDAVFHRHLPPGERRHISAVEITGRYLRGTRPMFDAVAYGNDRVAFVIHQLPLGRGPHIPQDVAVLGYDNTVSTGELFLPPLSTIQLPHYEIGHLSALHLIQGLDHRDTVRIGSPWFPHAPI